MRVDNRCSKSERCALCTHACSIYILQEGCEDEDQEMKDAIATIELVAEPLEAWAEEDEVCVSGC